MRWLTAHRARLGGSFATMLGLILTVGCATTSVSSTSDTQSPMAEHAAGAVEHPLLVGIPLPSGFRVVPEHTVQVISGKVRLANCEFEGSKDPGAVTRFYKEYMPSAGFSLRQERYVRGEYVLEFDSSSERCTVRVRGSRFKTTLNVDIGPTPKGAVEQEPARISTRP